MYTLRNVAVIIIFTGSYSECLVSTVTQPNDIFSVAFRLEFPCYGLPSWGFVITLIGHTTICRSSLDEWSAWRIEPYLTTNKFHKTRISLSPERLEPTIPARQQRKIHPLDRAATGIGHIVYTVRGFLNYLLDKVVIAPKRGHYEGVLISP